ncbi:MAG: cytochrome c peroxidase [Bacteroidales bacterium]|jgi:cytochrome c peroxidase|nr:cytochrome c peroxidase [Bacteroidales bacterium]MDD2824892.1 cytochrome c peroxidase [Bacteroidales bacterium]MDD3101052.1 cytochrome c peroxidase [Bacteroidales bacterium]MDD3639669.1 cytochrome c peroxidase [Bacteroidales bacterium]MDD3944251.1 cytochrome c peroxidase [Bacteroidales bacterium]
MIKKLLKILWRITGSVIIMIGAGILMSRIVNKAPSADLKNADQMYAIIDQGGCLICHGGSEDFCTHINWPVFGQAIRRDAEKAIRYADASPELDKLFMDLPIDKTHLMKLQHVVSRRSMPPLSFTIIHWKAPMTRDKQEIFLAWIYNQLSTHFSHPVPVGKKTFQPIVPIPDTFSTDQAKVMLGNALYHDTRLSSDNTVSCATCHNPERGGVDNLDYSVGVFNQPGTTTTLSSFNAVLDPFFFWDGKASSLKEQLSIALLDPVKMGNESFDEIAAKLQADPSFTSRFLESYPDGFSLETVTDALQEYHKTLITPDSPFDWYLKGQTDAIGHLEQRGYELFKRYGCATCHNSAGMGGNSFQLMGVAHSFFPDREKVMLEDLGRYKITSRAEDMHKFKVPGLRNVALTYPYFHNASAKTLEQAVTDMAYYQRNKELSKRKIHKIVLFLKTLSTEETTSE